VVADFFRQRGINRDNPAPLAQFDCYEDAYWFLYLVLGRGKALRYGIGVGREGFTCRAPKKSAR